MLVMIKATLYERTVGLCVRVWTLGKVWEDRSLEVTAGGLGGERTLWRQESVFKIFRTRCSAIAERPRCRVRYSFRQK